MKAIETGSSRAVDHTQGSTYGHMTATYSAVSNDLQSLRKITHIDQPSCVKVWYYMRSSASSIALSAQSTSTTGEKRTVWAAGLSSTSNRWEFASFNIPILPAMGLKFIDFNVGPLKLTDVAAIDDISLTAGKCPHRFDCTFEEDDVMCGYQPERFDADFWANWVWTSAGSPDAKNAPRHDHTDPNNKMGHYLFVQLPSLFDNHEERKPIRFQSPVLDGPLDKENEPGCLSLWYQFVVADDDRAELTVEFRDLQNSEVAGPVIVTQSTGLEWTQLKLTINKGITILIYKWS